MLNNDTDKHTSMGGGEGQRGKTQQNEEQKVTT